MDIAHSLEKAEKQEFKVTCPFCSVGCRFKIMKGLDEVIFSNRTTDVLDFDYMNEINEGSLCPRGHFSYELLSHPMRLGRSFFRSNDHLQEEIPELIFQKIVGELDARSLKMPLGILVNPMLSLHDIRALLDFASNNSIEAIDFVAPLDRHLFRAMMDNPFQYQKCDDPRILKKLNYSLCIGDVFSKQPVLSRHLLHAKYALRQNALFSLSPIPTRTSWFGNIQLFHRPHTEPLYLAYLFSKLYPQLKKEHKQPEAQLLAQMIHDRLEPLITKNIPPEHVRYLDFIVEFLRSDKKSAIFFSTHHYNVLGSYLSGILCAGISYLTGNYFIPLYTDGNFNAIEELSRDLFPQLYIGKKPMLHTVASNYFQYMFAVGWNPNTYIPGTIQFPDSLKWIISTIIQDDYPSNTEALLPMTHIYEQMDLRTNFVSWQSIGSSPVKSPIGSAKTLAYFVYLLHQQAIEQKVSLKSTKLAKYEVGWEDSMLAEMNYYRKKLEEIEVMSGTWLIPDDHAAHYKDANLTQYSSWAKKDCVNELLSISPSIAKPMGLKHGQYVNLNFNRHQIPSKIDFTPSLPADRVIAYAHYLPVRKLIPGEFADHNKEYYFWCPKIQFK